MQSVRNFLVSTSGAKLQENALLNFIVYTTVVGEEALDVMEGTVSQKQLLGSGGLGGGGNYLRAMR